MVEPVTLRLPFEGTWLVQNSPARRVPSHGTDLFASAYAIDFVAVRGRRTASTRDLRTLLTTEPNGRFVGFGLPILAPLTGTVVRVHDGEEDHAARRSPATLLAYALSQRRRAASGAVGLAGNHVVIRGARGAVFVVLAHLRAGSIRVEEGTTVVVGDVVGACGNSGNSTQPHVHVQAMDGADPLDARAIPLLFRDYRVHPRRGATLPVEQGVPHERAIVSPI